MKLKFVYKGGKGSGFHGHAGIRGHQGGSQAGGSVPDWLLGDNSTPEERAAAHEAVNQVHGTTRVIALAHGQGLADVEAARKRDAEGMAKANWDIKKAGKDAELKKGDVIASVVSQDDGPRRFYAVSYHNTKTDRTVWDSEKWDFGDEGWKKAMSRAESRIDEMTALLSKPTKKPHKRLRGAGIDYSIQD